MKIKHKFVPFPSTQVNNNKSLVLICVDVVKQSNCCSFKLKINVLPWVFLSDVEISL